MPDRRSVLLVIYDLPMTTILQRRKAAAFRKKLISKGFCCVQRSVYVKLIRNDNAISSEMASIKTLSPSDGTVQALPMSLQVFQGMQTLSGDGFAQNTFSDDLIFL